MGRSRLFFWKKKGEAPAAQPPDRWSVGIYTGPSIDRMQDPGQGINPVLTVDSITDHQAVLVADPFMVHHQHRWYLFFEAEVETGRGRIGKIGLASSGDGLCWTYEQMVLEEGFHLSYPYVFEFEKQMYMIPETRSIREVRLYKATRFPFEWQFEKRLLKGRRFADNSVFEYDGRWWMFTDSGNHTLQLFYCDHPLDKWKPHKKNPILKKDERYARPGGRVILIDGVPVRFAQDAYPRYGSRVWAFKITTLTPGAYEEIAITDPIISGSNSGGWNHQGMHTIDPHMVEENKIIACVDGLE